MPLQVYDRGTLFLDGTCLAEWQEGTADFPGAWAPVETMAKGGTIRGFARSEGRGMNVTFTLRVRRDGSEYQDIIDAWHNGDTVVITLWMGGKQISSEGKINLGGQGMKEGTLEVNFVGAAPDIL